LTIDPQVKTLDSKTFTYHVQPSTTVVELKAMVAADTGIRTDLQRIIFRGKVCISQPHSFPATSLLPSLSRS
jgi:hypothetical protein